MKKETIFSMKKFLLSSAVLAGTLLSLNFAHAEEVGEVMGGSHLPPVRVWQTSHTSKPKESKQTLWAEDNMSMTTATLPQQYPSQYEYQYGYDGSPVYYGYHDWYGYWHNYTDEWGNPMYYWNGYYYYY